MHTSEGKKRQYVLLDAGVFIGALLKGDPRHQEARLLVEQARRGELAACTTAGILSEVYGALTWEKAQPRHPPTQAANAARLNSNQFSCWTALRRFSSGAIRSACPVPSNGELLAILGQMNQETAESQPAHA